MTDVRLHVDEDYENDCVTITDNLEQLQTSFGSEIILSPREDALTLVNELNIQCAVNEMLIEHLERYEDPDDIMYWIQEVREDME
ncbi:MAG: hypothetical protein IJF83_05715 [Methanobrevibacter sp.]|nr:hypothetical protein [Methanobrevibacter sp.]